MRKGEGRREWKEGEREGDRQAFYKGQLDLWLTLAVNQSAFL